MATLSNIVKLTKAQYTTLLNGGSITSGGVTYYYDANTFYLIDNEWAYERNAISSSFFVRYRYVDNNILVHVHFYNYGTISSIPYTVISNLDSTLRPQVTMRGSVTGDISSNTGRYPVNVDINPDGTIKLYPIFPSQYSGSCTAMYIFGDVYYYVN